MCRIIYALAIAVVSTGCMVSTADLRGTVLVTTDAETTTDDGGTQDTLAPREDGSGLEAAVAQDGGTDSTDALEQQQDADATDTLGGFCSNDSQCSDGQHCEARTNACYIPGVCAADSECPANLCDQTRRMCSACTPNPPLGCRPYEVCLPIVGEGWYCKPAT